jgi:hypothetical protein
MTVLGNPFIAPGGWTVTVKGPATILQAPEGDSWIALADTAAKDADAALAAAWAAYKPDAKWPLKLAKNPHSPRRANTSTCSQRGNKARKNALAAAALGG